VADAWKATIKHLARSVRDRRLVLDLSQWKLSKTAGVSLRRIQQIEAEEETTNPSLRVLTQIATALGTTVPELLAPERGKPRAVRKRATKKRAVKKKR